MTKVKICGIRTVAEVAHMNEAAVDYVGFVFAPSRRRVSAEEAKNLRSQLDDAIVPVGVFVDHPIHVIVELVDDGVIDMIQLHGKESPGYISSLKAETDATVMKAIDMNAKAFSPSAFPNADMLLLDGGPGGMGECFDWSLAKDVGMSFFLAGGLDMDNVRRAIEVAAPYAVDISSGVETNGRKDRGSVMEVVRRVRYVQG